MNRLFALLLCGILASPPAAAQEPDAAGRLKRARACQAALDYDCAEAELAGGRAGLTNLPLGTRLGILRLSAEVALATGRKKDAMNHLKALLEADPLFAPPPGAWPSGWQADLESARAEMPDLQPPDLEVLAPMDLRAGSAANVRVRVSDRSGVGPVVLAVGGSPPLRIPMTSLDGVAWTATVPAELVTPPVLPLWIEAHDLKGNGPARWGSPVNPERIPVGRALPPPPPPLVKRWWFWTVLGVAAAGTGVGIYYLSRIGRSPGGAGSPGPGRLDVEVRWPSPSD